MSLNIIDNRFHLHNTTNKWMSFTSSRLFSFSSQLTKTKRKMVEIIDSLMSLWSLSNRCWKSLFFSSVTSIGSRSIMNLIQSVEDEKKQHNGWWAIEINNDCLIFQLIQNSRDWSSRHIAIIIRSTMEIDLSFVIYKLSREKKRKTLIQNAWTPGKTSRSIWSSHLLIQSAGQRST